MSGKSPSYLVVFIPSPALLQKKNRSLNRRGVELTRFDLFYCFLVRDKNRLKVYLVYVECLFHRRHRCKKINLRGVELARFVSFYCFLVREKIGLLYMYIICLVFIPSPALSQNNKQASDWVDTEVPPTSRMACSKGMLH